MFLILLLSWFVLRSKLGQFYKAVYLVTPVAVVLVTAGMLLYTWPLMPYIAGILFTGGILFYLYMNRGHWYYYYATLLVAFTLMLFMLCGGQI
jgi:hypothetical protein